jgi:hypothetical protein
MGRPGCNPWIRLRLAPGSWYLRFALSAGPGYHPRPSFLGGRISWSPWAQPLVPSSAGPWELVFAFCPERRPWLPPPALVPGRSYFMVALGATPGSDFGSPLGVGICALP